MTISSCLDQATSNLSVPSDWNVRRVGTFATKVGSGATPRGGKSVYVNTRVSHALIRSQHVFDRRFEIAGLAFIAKEHSNELRNAEVRSGDILLNITGDGVTFARACIVPDEILPACVNQHVSIIRVDQKACVPGYLLAFLTHPLTKRYIESFNTGGSRRAITKGHIESFEVPLPPLPIQRRIAGILSAYDELIENNQRRIKILEEMARSLYREWFVHFRFPGHEKVKMVPSPLGHIPQGWEVKSLDDVVEDIVDYRGKTPTKLNGEWANEGIIALSALNVKGGRLVNLGKSKHVSEELYSRWMKNPLKCGDILMTSEAPLGELFFLCKEERYCLSQRLYSIRASHRVIAPIILYLSLESEQAQHELRSRASGATVSGIRQSELRKILIIVPPRAVQAQAEPVLSKWAELKSTLQASEVNLRRTRDLLLPRLLSGQIDVNSVESVA